MAAQSSRRGLLAGVASVVAAGAVAATPAGAAPALPDDAKLLELHRELRAHGQLMTAIIEEGKHHPPGITPESIDQEERLATAIGIECDIIEDIRAIPSRTLAGLQVKAATLLMLLERYVLNRGAGISNEIDERDCEEEDRMALTLARELLAWGAAA